MDLHLWDERFVRFKIHKISKIKGFAGGVVKDLSGKHPVSALMEVCSKRRWGQPEFTLLTDPGAGNNRSYLYKVREAKVALLMILRHLELLKCFLLEQLES